MTFSDPIPSHTRHEHNKVCTTLWSANQHLGENRKPDFSWMRRFQQWHRGQAALAGGCMQRQTPNGLWKACWSFRPREAPPFRQCARSSSKAPSSCQRLSYRLYFLAYLLSLCIGTLYSFLSFAGRFGLCAIFAPTVVQFLAPAAHISLSFWHPPYSFFYPGLIFCLSSFLTFVFR
ncbi:uncharacterized protein EI90DRAFT_2488172 [Cantharellus anzutake]|uniref:uncharacterized protein n=1 Tax=Cantharellus anzutake TaxID=1750568 RepID=UPI001908F679|nr:uncharacterized protein EI90DRAFT_2488172 [Cantharellus anzutake]KAF8321977.1 hypothetical protein EI90DRAFT_2488172 [Cantharellus anzutake]